MANPAAPEPDPAVAEPSPLASLRKLLFGPPKDIRDPQVGIVDSSKFKGRHEVR